MDSIDKALENLNRNLQERTQRQTIPFNEFLELLTEKPDRTIRNVFQVFHDMIRAYVGEGIQEYPNDPESINYMSYDCNRLFVEGADRPFLADRIFSNRFVNHFETLRRGAQQNKIYIFEGPPGSGKSTFLDNLLMKFQEYANTDEGCRYEIVWRLERRALGTFHEADNYPLMQRFFHTVDDDVVDEQQSIEEQVSTVFSDDIVEVPCPSHDHPILIIPKAHRRAFFDDLFKNDEFKWKLFTHKEYEWVFKSNPCTICSSLYQALLDRLHSPMTVLRMLYARKYHFNRRLGEGISVFNPGDKLMQQNVLTNQMLQTRINNLLRDSNAVRYIFSRYAKTNNGIYTLMDIKSHNTERLHELHNIISEGVHKVEEIEENVNSLFFALMNPEDKTNIEGIQSFSDRIEYIRIGYVLDLNTEVEIYRNVFGRQIDEHFLPRVLHNFARVIISTRMNTKSAALSDWIEDAGTYRLYCDENLQLLKMELYAGYIPLWVNEEDRKRFSAQRRRRIIAESDTEGMSGLSGRDSIKIFSDFYTSFARDDQMITMSMLYQYFTRRRKDLLKYIPEGFLDSLIRMYDYTVLQEVKESLYYYNEAQIARDIQHYMFAVNFEIGAVQVCNFTGEKLEISEEFLRAIENRLIGVDVQASARHAFRSETQREYTSRTLTQELRLEKKAVGETTLFQSLHERYVHNLKEKVLEPFQQNENFRRAIKDYDTETFRTYDKRIREDVTWLISNLMTKRHYTQQGAKEMAIYVIDNDLAKKFSN